MSQNEAIRKHLEKGKAITPLEALERYGCFRLAARIDDLRNEGLDIETLTLTRNGKRYASYKLVGRHQASA